MLNSEPIKIDISPQVTIGGNLPFVLIAGLCVIESKESVFKHAEILKEITQNLGIPFIFKASFDKANRSSIKSFRGPGLDEGLNILNEIKQKLSLPILSDIHLPEQAAPAAKVLDIIQIPAFLSRQTDLLVAAAETGKPVNIKKGQFLSPWEIENVIRKIESAGSKKIILTERGFTFGYNNLVVDMRSLAIMRSFGYPIIFDATHSVMLPGGKGSRSTGQSEFIMPLSRAAAAVGVDAFFMEVHENPEKALSDSGNSLPLESLEDNLKQIVKIDRLVKNIQ